MGTSHVEHQKLVENARGGDLSAFAELVVRFQDMAISSAFSYLGDFHLAQDAAQEAFTIAYFNLHQLQESACFPGWLRGIVRHQCHRVLRAQSRQEVHLDDIAEAPASVTPATLFERQEVRRLMLDAVAELPQLEKEVITLFYLRERSQKEVSSLLGIPVTTVNNRLHSARQKLKFRTERLFAKIIKEDAMPKDFSTRVGEIIQTRGPLLDIEFEAGDLPAILTNLIVYGRPSKLDLAVQVTQRLGDRSVRCLAVKDTASLRPGAKVRTRPARISESPNWESAAWAIRQHQGESYTKYELLETGIKVIDLLCPLARGATVGFFGPYGAGKLVLLEELIGNVATEDLSFFSFVDSRDIHAVQELYETHPESLKALSPPVDNYFVISDRTETPAELRASHVLDCVILLSSELAASGIYPAVQPLASSSRFLKPEIVGKGHYEVALQVKEALQSLMDTPTISATVSRPENPCLSRARKLASFLTQPFFTAERYTHKPGRRVRCSETIKGCRSILSGEQDSLSETSFHFIGGVEEARGGNN